MPPFIVGVQKKRRKFTPKRSEGRHRCHGRRAQPRAATRSRIYRRKTGNQSVELLRADMFSQASIRSLAASVQERHPRIDVPVNNVGGLFWWRVVTREGNREVVDFGLKHWLERRIGMRAPYLQDARRSSYQSPGAEPAGEVLKYVRRSQYKMALTVGGRIWQDIVDQKAAAQERAYDLYDLQDSIWTAVVGVDTDGNAPGEGYSIVLIVLLMWSGT